MEIGTALIIGILVLGVIYWINDQKKREQERIEYNEKVEERKRSGKRHTLFQMIEEELIDECEMNWGEKYGLKYPFHLKEDDYDEAQKQLSRWIWVKLRVFERCMRQYPEFFDHEHSKEFVDEIRGDWEEKFPGVKRNILEENIEDWGPND